MILSIRRIFKKENYIIGDMFIDGQYFCDTLELPDKNNQPFISCIPVGEYDIKLSWSQHFQKDLPHVLNVPNRSNILIHPANHPKELLGCIAVGRNTIKGGLSESRFYSDMLNRLIANETDGVKLIIT